jgi:DnaJ-class molecular chaperone
MQETIAEFEVPRGFPNGFTITHVDAGHEMTDGRIGAVKISLWQEFPFGWKLTRSGNLAYEVTLPISDLVSGAVLTVQAPWGDKLQVSVLPSNLFSVLRGIVIKEPQMGLFNEYGDRTDLEVHITADWDNLTDRTMVDLLTVRLAHSLIYNPI